MIARARPASVPAHRRAWGCSILGARAAYTARVARRSRVWWNRLYAEGKIDLGKVQDKTLHNYLRYGPSFVSAEFGASALPKDAHSYTVDMVADSRGWTKKHGSNVRESAR